MTRLAVTAGEPAGIGPELCLALAATPWSERIVVLADPATLAARAKRIGRDVRLRIYPEEQRAGPEELLVLPQRLARPEVCGTPHPGNAGGLLEGLRRGVAGCRSGEFAALVTAPLQKSVIKQAGFAFTGHTEYLAELTAAATPVMLLVAGPLRVALASTHLPLRAVPDCITPERLGAVIDVLHHDLIRRFGIADPVIRVCGLNPHAGEQGHLGHEDAAIIAPAVERQRRRGRRVLGPVPADTAFLPVAGHADAVLAMYHDQGLPVLKYAGFGTAVNVTLGLPIVRTSVDHGTALDIAGKGTADSGSMLAAVELAFRLARQ